MDQYWRGRSSGSSGLHAARPGVQRLLFVYGPLTGRTLIDGAIGIVLGLYVCSHPPPTCWTCSSWTAASCARATEERGIAWYVLNLLVLMAGWFVVWTALTASRPESGATSVILAAAGEQRVDQSSAASGCTSCASSRSETAGSRPGWPASAPPRRESQAGSFW